MIVNTLSACVVNENVKVGFGKADLRDALPADRPIREPLEAHVVAFRQEQRAYCWVVLDFMDFDRSSVEQVRSAVSDACQLPSAHVHILTTHNHGAGGCDCLLMERIAEQAAGAARAALAAAVPAWMRYVRLSVPEPLSVIRRLQVPELQGSTTFFFGPCAENGFDTAEFLRHQFYTLQERHEVAYCGTSEAATRSIPKPTAADSRLAPGDPTLVLMHFEDGSGQPIGSLCRFAAHAVCCNRPEHYSSDYPYYVRQTLVEHLGGGAVFLNGPCGDIAPAIYDKFAEGERQIGIRLGELAAQAIAGIPPQRLTQLTDEILEISLPVRDDMSEPDAPEPVIPAAEISNSAACRLSLPEIKRQAERLQFIRKAGFLNRIWRSGEPAEQVRRREITARLGLLRLNDVHLLAFPGETFSATAEWVRQASGVAEVVTVTEHDRTVMYLPPPEEYRRGGYEVTCCLVSPEAEPLLARTALALLRRFEHSETAGGDKYVGKRLECG